MSHPRRPHTACVLPRHRLANSTPWVSHLLLSLLHPAEVVVEALHLLLLLRPLHLPNPLFLQISPHLLLSPVAHHDLSLHPLEQERAEELCWIRSDWGRSSEM